MTEIEQIIKKEIGDADYIWVSGKQISVATVAKAIELYVIKVRIEENQYYMGYNEYVLEVVRDDEENRVAELKKGLKNE